jgi:hypothetical protein
MPPLLFTGMVNGGPLIRLCIITPNLLKDMMILAGDVQ